jgi:hypothetical protein
MQAFSIFATLLVALASCSSSSGSESCPDGTQPVPAVVTVVDATTGARICDAYITHKGSPYCTWNNACPCVAPVGASGTVLTASSRGYATGAVTITFTGEHPSDCTLRNVGTIALSKGGGTAGCSQRDTDYCADHRVCYSAPLDPGCTDTGETSPDQMAKFCCK